MSTLDNQGEEMARIVQLSEDQEFNNALATLLNKAYALGYADGAKRNISSVWASDITPPTEAVLPIDRRDLKKVAEVRNRITENPELPLDATIERLNLAIRPYNTLERHGIVTIADLLSMTSEEIIELVRFVHDDDKVRQSTLRQIEEAVSQYGYTFDIAAALEFDYEVDFSDLEITSQG